MYGDVFVLFLLSLALKEFGEPEPMRGVSVDLRADLKQFGPASKLREATCTFASSFCYLHESKVMADPETREEYRILSARTIPGFK